jgi:ADP-heptose:LPS heptosyltransferase
MRVVDVIKDFERNNIKFKKGHSYVMAEDIEGQFRSVNGDCIGMSHPIDAIYRKYKGEDLTGKRLMCWRTGGIGDMFFLSPVFRHIKKIYKNSFIRMASGCKQPLENLPEIDELYDMPFDSNLLKDVDYHLMFQGIIEGSSEKSKTTHAADMFFSYFNIDSTHLSPKEKKPQLVFTETEKQWLEKECKKLGILDNEFVVGIQIETSSPIRNYPKEKMKFIVEMLAHEKNIKIVLIGSVQQKMISEFLKGNNSNVITATNYNIRQSIILLNRYNIVVAPDSFMIQMAGALDKPLIGIYGPFPSKVRMKYFKNAIGLDSQVVCSPCFKHDYKTCIKGHPSPCFSLINPEDILQAIDYLRNKFHGGHFEYMKKFLAVPDFKDLETYFLSADKGLCFFGGYYKHYNMIHVEPNKFTKPDIEDLNHSFERNKYPFVLFMNNFNFQNGSVFQNSKSMVRPGGYFIAYKQGISEQFFNELKRDIGHQLIIFQSTFNQSTQEGIIVARKPF